MPDADYWIARLQLASHPEGGYFRRSGTAAETIDRIALPDRYRGNRRC